MEKILFSLFVFLTFFNFSAFGEALDCDTFVEKLKKAEHGARTAQESYKGKGVALNVLSVLENYPGTAQETNVFFEKTLAANSDKPGKFTPMCALEEFHAATIKLVSSAYILLFSKEEKARVKSALLKILNAELAHPVSQLQRVKFFAHLIDHAVEMKIIGLEKASKDSVSKIRKTAETFTKGSFLIEIKEANRLNLELQKVVAKIQ